MLKSHVKLMIFGTMLVKLLTFYVPKVGRRATFGSGRNSIKFWRHSPVSGLGSCTPFSTYNVCDDTCDLKRKSKRPKNPSNHLGQRTCRK